MELGPADHLRLRPRAGRARARDETKWRERTKVHHSKHSVMQETRGQLLRGGPPALRQHCACRPSAGIEHPPLGGTRLRGRRGTMEYLRGRVIVVGSTNRLSTLPMASRRPGRRVPAAFVGAGGLDPSAKPRLQTYHGVRHLVLSRMGPLARPSLRTRHLDAASRAVSIEVATPWPHPTPGSPGGIPATPTSRRGRHRPAPFGNC